METTLGVGIKKAKKTFDDIKRKKYLRGSLGVGRIVEDYEKIICFVRKIDILRFKKESFSNSIESRKFFYNIELHGLKQNNEKPVFYIFKGIDFSDNVELRINNANVIFQDCTFNKCVNVRGSSMVTFRDCLFKFGVDVVGAIDVKFEHNTYTPDRMASEVFLNVYNAKKLTFLNDSFNCRSKDFPEYSSRFGFEINAEEVNVIDSKLDANNHNAYIYAKRMLIKESLLNVDELNIKADCLKFEDGLVVGKKRVFLDLKQADSVLSINAPKIFCNGLEFDSKIQKSSDVDRFVKAAVKRKQLEESLETINTMKQDENCNNDESQLVLKKVEKNI